MAWGVIATYDTAVSQFLPADLAQDAPKTWQIMARTADYLPAWPFWAWALILGALLVTISIEYAFHYVKDAHSGVPKPTMAEATKTFQAELRRRADENRKALYGAATEKKSYALPKEATKINLREVTNVALGKLLTESARQIDEMADRHFRSHSDKELVNLFNQHFAAKFFWLYEEARNRGHREEPLELYYKHPDTLKNVRHLSERMRALGSRLPLYLDV